MFDTRGIPFVLLDIACLILAGLPLAAFNLGKIKPYQRGFFCNDESIKYPFHPSTVTSTVLYTVGFSLPICSMIFGECLSVHFKRVNSKSSFGNNYLACVYKAVGTFLFGAAMSQSLTDIAKYSIGRLRPHFLDVCKPVMLDQLCKTGGYVENFTCAGDKTMVNEGRLSFYSGHSSFSMYCMLFLAREKCVLLKAVGSGGTLSWQLQQPVVRMGFVVARKGPALQAVYYQRAVAYARDPATVAGVKRKRSSSELRHPTPSRPQRGLIENRGPRTALQSEAHPGYNYRTNNSKAHRPRCPSVQLNHLP
ncbi:hypothetical protein JZ751_011788 [Albula glossodonta]|uniref:Phospholipid phosphatase 1 n=1 Tax=Albula glossodonta TaxID=121402 RepID=A0A8T2PQP5_9TELE|nr:hypothetical protein JZ751_011788 [Albula glossodonta]